MNRRRTLPQMGAGPYRVDSLHKCLEAAGRAARFVTDARLATLALNYFSYINGRICTSGFS